MEIQKCTKANFDFILMNLNDYWEVKENDQERYNTIKILHHPMMLFEFGSWAFTALIDNFVAAYLFGVLSFEMEEPHGYIHLIATHKNYKRQKLASKLFLHFETLARNQGCKYLKAITQSKNATSIAFHQNLGMQLLGEPNEEGIRVVKNYAGPFAGDRVVFHKSIQ